MIEIHMPRLSDTMEEGVIATWRKQVGDQVGRGDVIAEIETDKAVMELEAYDDGVLEKVLVGEGATVPIGTPIGLLGDGSGTQTPDSPTTAEPSEAVGESVLEDAAQSGTDAPAAVSNGEKPSRPKSSPLARAVAKEKGVDLSTVTGTGPGGRIIRVDIDAAARTEPAPSASTPVPAVLDSTTPESTAPESTAPTGVQDRQEDEDVEDIPLKTIQKVSAKRLTESKQQAPHFYLTSAVDVTDLLTFRGELNQRLQAVDGPKVSVNDLIVKAVATALRADLSVNVSFAGDSLRRHKRINLGVAVAIESGLVVPVIRDADRKSVSEIAAEGREKAGRAREGKLGPDEMSGGTFTISNLGMFGIEEFTAVINPPEAAILAVGATQDEVRVRDGEFVARKMLRITMSADHRAVDGAVGAVFLQRLTALLEDPLRIIA